MEAKKLSFSFSSSAKPSRPHQPQFDSQESGAGDEAKRKYLTNFDAADALKPFDDKPVIAPIPNAEFHNPAVNRLKNLVSLPSEEDDPNAAAVAGAKFVLDTSTGEAPASNIGYGLTLRSGGQSIGDGAKNDLVSAKGSGRGSKNAPEDDLMVRRFREDMQVLADDRGEEEFKDINVEDFGAAVLKGYGWSEGMVIGRNRKAADPKVFEYKRKGGSEGLGYNPSSEDPKKKRGVWVAGEEKGSNKQKENKKQKSEFEEKNIRVISGRFKGLKGKLLKRLDATEFLVKLHESGKEVGLEDDMFVELGSVEEDNFLRRQKKLDVQEKNGRKDDRRKDWRGSENDRKEKKNTHGFKEGSESVSVKKEKIVRWLRSHIRVKIISKEIKGGKLYLKRGQVIDVVGPTTCDISMDESGELVQGVDQEFLETALPKTGGSVIVLYGKHKGIFGNLVKRNTEDETGIVRDADSHELINVHLDEIAEYTGDPSDLGY